MGNVLTAGGGFYAAGTGTWTASIYPSLKYYDRYSYGTTNNDVDAYKRGKLGDATKEILKVVRETGGWYSDYSWFPNLSLPWFLRGGRASAGSAAGVLHFDRHWGGGRSYYGSRVALVAY